MNRRAHLWTLNGTVPEACTDAIRWARWLDANLNNRHVADTQVEDVVRVSTVFLGLDHSFGDGPPLLFETMCFAADDWGATESLPFARYSTWQQAQEGHKQIVEEVKQITARARADATALCFRTTPAPGHEREQ